MVLYLYLMFYINVLEISLPNICTWDTHKENSGLIPNRLLFPKGVLTFPLFKFLTKVEQSSARR